jgi:hypothetical protein
MTKWKTVERREAALKRMLSNAGTAVNALDGRLAP